MKSASPTPRVARIAWRPSYRIVSSRFPPVGVFDAIAEPADIDAICELEGLTNPRLRLELGQIALVPEGRRISGPGTTPIMATFAHPNPEGTRFADGSQGVYYAARSRDTAVAETVHHRQLFLARTAEPPTTLEMRCYLANIGGRFHDLRGGWPAMHDPDSYAASQALGRRLRDAGSNGVVYDSVRRRGGQCVAVFYPDLVAPVVQGPHLFYSWNGERITHAIVADEVLQFDA
ncbi:MAG TPA: RES family NAD+ phosphorylase [Rhodanobacteraceae bacterium]|nr:RES family NAD+ phosphorylase [Rhodanobacteraceae bacterium]